MNKKILVVDDDPLVLESLSLLLSHEGYLLELIAKSFLIEKSISRFQPDLIILDIWLGDGDGRKICDQIKGQPHTAYIPIILITGLSYEEISKFDCEADAILGKPYDADTLLQTIDGLI